MKLLFDENLSLRLVERLADVFPGSQHVVSVGLEHAADREVWEYAKANEFVLVSKDGDFQQLSFVYDRPPQVIWLHVGNCSTGTIEGLLRRAQPRIAEFVGNEEGALLIIDP